MTQIDVSTLSGKTMPATVWQTADGLVKLRNTKGLWEVIGEVVKAWENLKKHKYTSHIIDLKEKKETRLNQYGSTKSKSLRYLLDIPEDIINMIRILYPIDELPFDKKFFREFGKRFPQYKVADKI